VRVVDEGAVDDVGEPAFEDADGFESAVAAGFAAARESKTRSKSDRSRAEPRSVFGNCGSGAEAWPPSPALVCRAAPFERAGELLVPKNASGVVTCGFALG
jgi:hypothetical protein